jgi:hypothetical protein
MPATLALALMLAQSPSTEAADAAKMERIRRELAETPAIVVSSPLPREGLVFRMTVYARKPGRPVWEDLSGVPPYIRPPFPSYHFEFMQQVTPEEFRSATLYPMGLPIGTLIELLAKHLKAADRKRRETRAEKEVRQALEQFLACKADPGRPGC